VTAPALAPVALHEGAPGPANAKAELETALAFALSGPRSPCGVSAITITGGLATGKSTLLDQIADALGRRGYLVLAASPSPADSRIALAAVHDLLADISRPAFGAVSAASGHAALRRAAIGLVGQVRAKQPVALAIDDAGNIDPVSTMMLSALTRQPGRHPLLAVLAHTRGTHAAHSGEPMLAPLRRHQAVATLTPMPLDSAAVAAILHQQGMRDVPPALADRIRARSAGHPLLAWAAARAAADAQASGHDAGEPPVPADVAAELVTRLFGQQPRLREVAAAIAFLDGVPPRYMALLSTVIAGSGDSAAQALSALDRLGLLAQSAATGTYQLVGQVLAEALAQTTDPATSWVWHRRAVKWLRARPPTTANLIALAEHTLAVAEPGDEVAIRTLIKAADAVCETQPALSSRWYQAALTLTPAASALRVRAYTGLARASCLTGDTAAAVRVGRRALQELTPGPDRRRTLQLVTEASVLGDGALDYLDRCGEQKTPHLLAISAHLLARSGRLAEARRAASLVRQALEADGTDGDLHHCLMHLAHAHGLLARPADMLAAIDRTLAASPASPRRAITVHVNGAYLLALHGSAEASPLIERCRALVEQTGCGLGRTELALAEFVDDYRTGKWDHLLDASPALKSALAAGSANNGLTVVEALEADVLAHRGNWAQAKKTLASRPLCASGESLRAWAETGIDIRGGNAGAALAPLGEALARARVPKFREFLLVRLAEAQLLDADLEGAARTLSSVAPRDLGRATTLAGLNAARLRACLTSDAGRLGECLRQAEARQAALLTAQIRFDLGQLGNDHESDLRKAYEAFHALGADPWRRAVAHRLREAGYKMPRHRTPRPVGLTDAEMQVARLVQQGRRNREIADVLTMSIKTVEAYLTRAYAKTNCSSRLELARYLDQNSQLYA
jgi:DNA-binding CsgD family transcriptional regulator